ncbi:DREPP family [Dillenia turbinata]|uniref:DREPP family n=1 Tax=Dillenia turbinata TaxID=194707 RepID=A0AAN8UK26_9MAGN
MGYWKSKVLPKIKKVFEKDSTKKAAAAEACKSFDDSKSLIKEPKEGGLKKSSAAVEKFMQELVKIEFPGSKPVSEACSKYGVAYVGGPVLFVLEKVSTYITVETPQAQDATKVEAEAAETKDKEAEIVVEESKTAAAPEASEKVLPVAEPEPEPEPASASASEPMPEAPKEKEEVTPAA